MRCLFGERREEQSAFLGGFLLVAVFLCSFFFICYEIDHFRQPGSRNVSFHTGGACEAFSSPFWHCNLGRNFTLYILTQAGKNPPPSWGVLFWGYGCLPLPLVGFPFPTRTLWGISDYWCAIPPTFPWALSIGVGNMGSFSSENAEAVHQFLTCRSTLSSVLAPSFSAGRGSDDAFYFSVFPLLLCLPFLPRLLFHFFLSPFVPLLLASFSLHFLLLVLFLLMTTDSFSRQLPRA